MQEHQALHGPHLCWGFSCLMETPSPVSHPESPVPQVVPQWLHLCCVGQACQAPLMKVGAGRQLRPLPGRPTASFRWVCLTLLWLSSAGVTVEVPEGCHIFLGHWGASCCPGFPNIIRGHRIIPVPWLMLETSLPVQSLSSAFPVCVVPAAG